MGVVPEEAAVGGGERAAWSTEDRAERYREQADRFQKMAEMEAEPRARERLLELAGQYFALAYRVTTQKARTAAGLLPAIRRRNG